MIQATATAIGNRYQLEIVHPDTNQLEIKNVASKGEGLRIVYFMNRDYMLKKTTGWLRQRMYGADPIRTQEAAKLLVMLGYYEHLSFQRLCSVINRYRSVIEEIAPGAKSRYHNYYLTRIIPLLDDAAEIGS